MRNNPFTGANYLLRGAAIIMRPTIRPFVIVPLLVNTLLFSVLIVYGAGQFNDLILRLLPESLNWLSWLLWPLFAIAVAIIGFFTFIHLGNFISAPFNGLLSERIELQIKGALKKEPFHLKQFLFTLWPSFLAEIQKIVYFLIRAVPFFLLFWVPVVNIAASLVWMVFSAWMISLEYIDYPMANHDILFSNQRKIVREKKWLVLGFGGAALVLLMVPVLNFFVMPITVAGATLMWVEQFEHA